MLIMKLHRDLLLEALAVGIMLSIVWGWVPMMPFKTVITGMLVHIICEFTGINKWYCRNGFACRRTVK